MHRTSQVHSYVGCEVPIARGCVRFERSGITRKTWKGGVSESLEEIEGKKANAEWS